MANTLISTPILLTMGNLSSNHGNRFRSAEEASAFPVIMGDPEVSRSKKTANSDSFHIPEGLKPEQRYSHALESFRRVLLSKGCNLEQMTLQKKDLPLLQRFLAECGLSEAKRESFFKDLLHDHPRGEIRLSDFFRKLEELPSPRDYGEDSMALCSSAMPHMEFLLQKQGLNPKEAGRILEQARTPKGEMQVERILSEVKQVKESPESSSKETSGKRNDSSQRMKDVIQQIAERVIIEDQRKQSVPAIPILPQAKSSLQGFTEQESSGVAPHRLPGLRGSKGEKSKGAGRFHESQQEGKAENHDQTQGVGQSNAEQRKSNAPSHDIGPKKDGQNPLEKAGVESHVRGEIKVGNRGISPEISTPGVSDSVGRFSQTYSTTSLQKGTELPQGFIPHYFLEQAGRQIARSMVRGEKTLSMLLRPPDLGAVRIQMEMNENVLKLEVLAENDAVRELFISRVPELKQVLSDQGLRLTNLDVQVGNWGGESQAGSQQALKEGFIRDGKWSQAIMRDPFTVLNEPMDATLADPYSLMRKDHLVDLMI